MHSSGYTAAEIAEALHCSLSKIYEVTRDPRAQALLGAKEEMLRAEFDQLRERANHAVRRALDADDHKVRLQAARLFYERQGDLEPAAQSRSETAEDVIQRMLNVTFNLNVRGRLEDDAELGGLDCNEPQRRSPSPSLQVIRQGHREAQEVREADAQAECPSLQE